MAVMPVTDANGATSNDVVSPGSGDRPVAEIARAQGFGLNGRAKETGETSARAGD